jgi:hypothetical protein
MVTADEIGRVTVFAALEHGECERISRGTVFSVNGIQGDSGSLIAYRPLG